jgi:hypothetical protein
VDCVRLERIDLRASLSSWITTAMTSLHAAFHEGLGGYINWPTTSSPAAYRDPDAFSRCANMFEWYFRQPSCQACPPGGRTWVYETSQAIIGRHSIADARAFYRRHLLFNSEVTCRLETMLHRYRIRPENTIAVSWRGTDSVVDGRPRTPIETYFPVIDAILEAEPDAAIFAKPEEHGAAEALLRRYERVIIPSEFFTAPTGATQMQDWLSTETGYERGMQVILLILTFARCKYLVRNPANLSEIASYLSDGTVLRFGL